MTSKYVLGGFSLVLVLVGAIVLLFNGSGDSPADGDESIGPAIRVLGNAVKSPVASSAETNVAGSVKKRKSKNKGRGAAEFVGVTEARDDLSPKDKRLLMAIEDGMDDDNLEKILKILPEASATTNVEVRSELVDALGWFGVPAMNHLLPFMADSDDDVRQSAIDSWTSSLGDIEDEKMKARLITAVMQVLNDEDALEHMMTELIDMDEKLALQVLVDVIEGRKASKQAIVAAKEQYEFLTGDEYTTIEAADKWLEENYEPSSQENAADGK